MTINDNNNIINNNIYYYTNSGVTSITISEILQPFTSYFINCSSSNSIQLLHNNGNNLLAMFSNFIEPNNNVVSDTELIYKYSNSSLTTQNISDLLHSTNNNLLLPQQTASNLVVNNNENIVINTNNNIILDEILEEDINKNIEKSINNLLKEILMSV